MGYHLKCLIHENNSSLFFKFQSRRQTNLPQYQVTLQTGVNNYYTHFESKTTVPSRRERNLEVVGWLVTVCIVASPWCCILVSEVG